MQNCGADNWALLNHPFDTDWPITNNSSSGIQEPSGYSEAVPGPKNEQWLAAMALQVKSLEVIGIRTLVDIS